MGEPSALGADQRVLGSRGLATRRRLLEALSALLLERSFREMTVIDVARAAGTSPATFYQYFSEVEQALLVLTEEVVDETEAFADLVDPLTWQEGGASSVRAVVDAVFDFWEKHRSIMRIVELKAAEGDERFYRRRVLALNRLFKAVVAVIESSQHRGLIDPYVDASATAGALVSMVVHVAAHREAFEEWGVADEGLRQSISRIVALSATGR